MLAPHALPAPRVALYARYSSTLQDSRSVEDQLADCRARARAEGWQVVESFADHAISGAVRERPGLNALLAMVARGEAELVLSEALDRVSRDQEDIANIWKRLQFAGARLITLSEGEIGELHIGLKGTMSALFRKDLADKIRRGQRGRVAAGRIPGGLAYGYAKVIALDARGEPERGLRAIHPKQAEVVQRIYRQFIAGLSPQAIARQLNAEGVPGPGGRRWAAGFINGDPQRGNGILANEIYIGQLHYNRHAMVRDPATRRRVSRPNPRSAWQSREMPELRIITDAEWQAVRARRQAIIGKPAHQQRRPRRLLSGLIQCGQCGSTMIIRDKYSWACASQLQGKGCTNGRKLKIAGLDERVLAALKSQLLQPEAVSLFVRQYHETMAAQHGEASRERAKLERQHTAASTRLTNLIAAMAEGGSAFPEIRAALDKARTERDDAATKLANLAAGPTLALHPRLADVYRTEIEALAETLTTHPDAAEQAHPLIRSLIERIIATPTPDSRTGLTLQIHGRLQNLLALAGFPRPSPTLAQIMPVAEEGLGYYHPLTRGVVEG